LLIFIFPKQQKVRQNKPKNTRFCKKTS
jgi:hypothetical protein